MRFEFISLRFVGRLFFVMKMSFKFDTAKKFFRVLFDSEFICLFKSVARNSSLFRESISQVPKKVNLRE